MSNLGLLHCACVSLATSAIFPPFLGIFLSGRRDPEQSARNTTSTLHRPRAAALALPSGIAKLTRNSCGFRGSLIAPTRPQIPSPKPQQTPKGSAGSHCSQELTPHSREYVMKPNGSSPGCRSPPTQRTCGQVVFWSKGCKLFFFYVNSILRDLVATCRGRWREGAGSETCIFITLPSTVTVYKRENIVRPFCWCYVITKSTSLKLVKFTRLKIKMPRFCFDFCQAVKLCGLCRIKIILSYKYRHLTWKLKVIYFVFPGTQSVVYNYARIKKLIPKRFSCQVLRKVEAQMELTVGLNHVQTDLPRVCSSICSPRAAVEACPGSWAKHPEDEPAPSPAAAQPKVTLGTSERVRSQSTRS